jgi:hypothetical protein
MRTKVVSRGRGQRYSVAPCRTCNTFASALGAVEYN